LLLLWLVVGLDGLDLAAGFGAAFLVGGQLEVGLLARLDTLVRRGADDFVDGHVKVVTLHSQPSRRPFVAASWTYSRNPETPSGTTVAVSASASAASPEAGALGSSSLSSSRVPASSSAVETRPRTVKNTCDWPTP